MTGPAPAAKVPVLATSSSAVEGFMPTCTQSACIWLGPFLSEHRCRARLSCSQKIRERGSHNLGDERVDQRARIRLTGPEPEKTRSGPVDNFVAEVALEWCSQRRRHVHPCKSRAVGQLGSLPQRAPGCQAATERVWKLQCVERKQSEVLQKIYLVLKFFVLSSVPEGQRSLGFWNPKRVQFMGLQREPCQKKCLV